MKNNNKIILLMLILSFFLLIAGFIVISKHDNDDTDYKEMHLSINMPIDENDDFTNSILDDLTNALENNKWGYITANGLLRYQSIKKSYDVYMSIKYDSRNEFISYIQKFEIPYGSYLEMDKKKIKNYGTLYGFRIIYKNSIKEFDVDSDITNNLQDALVRKVKFVYNDKTYAFYYGKDEKKLESVIRDYIASKKLSDEIEILEVAK